MCLTGLGNLFAFKIQTSCPTLMCAGCVAGLRTEQVKAWWDFRAKGFLDHCFRWLHVSKGKASLGFSLLVAAFEKSLKHWEWDQVYSSCEDGGTAVAFHFSVGRSGPCSYYGRFLYACKYIYSFYNCQDYLLSLWICCRHAQVDFCFLLYFITVVKCALCCCF